MKAHDSIKHKVTSLALNKIGALEKHTNWIEKLCRDFEAVLSISSEDTSFKHACGVRQGNNLAPTLFIMFVQLVVEDSLDELKKKKALITEPIVQHHKKMCSEIT